MRNHQARIGRGGRRSEAIFTSQHSHKGTELGCTDSEEKSLASISEYLQRQVLFEDLSVIYLLLNCPCSQEAVDSNGTLLAEPPGAFPGLHIRRRVPAWTFR